MSRTVTLCLQLACHSHRFDIPARRKVPEFRTYERVFHRKVEGDALYSRNINFLLIFTAYFTVSFFKLENLKYLRRTKRNMKYIDNDSNLYVDVTFESCLCVKINGY